MGTTLCFDADDTLWHNEDMFAEAHGRFAQILSRYHDRENLERRLFETEMRNLKLYGYGCKGFALSAIETATEVAGDALSRREIQEIIALVHEMLQRRVVLLDGVAEVLAQLEQIYPLTLLTKGDLQDQERKLRDSGLLPRFSHHQVITEKDTASYQRMFEQWRIPPESVVMIGNSLRSDVLPTLELGATAIWIPYPLTWQHERAEPPVGHPRFHRLDSISRLPALLESLGLK